MCTEPFMNSKKSVWVVITLLFMVQPLWAQPELDYKQIKEQYKGESAIILNNEQIYYCNIEKNSLSIKGDHIFQLYYLDNKAISVSERSITYAPEFYVVDKIEATCYVPDGDKKFKKMKVTSFKDEDNMKGSSFYDGIKSKKFNFPGLESNAIAETKFTYRFLDPTYLGAFFFQLGIPCLKSSYTFVADKNITIDYKLFGNPKDIKFSQTVDGNKVIYKWEMVNVPEMKDYKDAVDDKYVEPHIYVYIKNYRTKNAETVTLSGSVKDLYKIDYNFIKNLNKQPIDIGLKLVVDSIMKVSENPAQRAKGIYYWLQQNMKYIAIENGLGGQIPREANDIFTKKYGDCKDFSSLLHVMFTTAGIPSHLCWIGTRSLPYTYEDLPLGYASNHMITAVPDNGKWIFVDGTDKHIPYGVPSAFIQGKEALISISPDSFVVVKVPVMPTAFSYSNMDLKMILDGTTLKGKGMLQLNGYNQTSWARELYYSASDQRQKELKKMLNVGNNKFDATDITYLNLFNNDSALRFNYNFTLPDYVKKIDDDIYVNMNFRKTFSDDKIDTAWNRTIAKEFSYTWFDEGNYSIEIPANYKVKKLPANTDFKSDDLNYSFTYSVVGNTVHFRHTSEYKKLTVEAAEFEAWNKQIDEILKRYKDLIILTKK